MILCECCKIREILREALTDVPDTNFTRNTIRGISMAPGEMDLLQVFWARRGKFVSYDAMYEVLWPRGQQPKDWRRIIAVYVCHLRQALSKSFQITNKHGQGYALEFEKPGRARLVS